jgi:SAM-dependent methyltransferase
VTGYTGTDRRVLREEQYRDSANLDARHAIYAYAERKQSLQDMAVALVPGGIAGKRVLDAGCGPGTYVPALAGAGLVAGADLSFGMLEEARRRNGSAVRAVQADVQHLPLADHAFDAVLAMHMLYHVPDRAEAIDELARVVRPQGVVLVVTNALDHQRETDGVLAEAYEAVTGRRFSRTKAGGNFPLEAAPSELGRRFDVELHPFGGTLRVPTAAPVVAYIGSMRSFVGLDDDAEWHGLLDEVGVRTQAVIDAEGCFTVTGSTGVLVCTPR